MLINKNLPNKFIDHINGNPLDNRIENMRLADYAVNSRNARKPTTNKTGIVGVFYRKPRPERGIFLGEWVANWREEGRPVSKSFSITKYGDTKAKELAIKTREEKIKHLNLNGAGYTERHGQ